MLMHRVALVVPHFAALIISRLFFRYLPDMDVDRLAGRREWTNKHELNFQCDIHHFYGLVSHRSEYTNLKIQQIF